MTNRHVHGLALVLLASCTASPGPISLSQPIIGGAVDQQDFAVGAVLIEDSTGEIVGICSGTLISRRVVLTAAHCVQIDDPDMPDAEPRQVFFGNNAFTGAGKIALVDVVKAEHHPNYDPNRIQDGNDFGLLLLKTAPPLTPLPINRTAVESRVGEAVRFVGFGITLGGRHDEGLKRQVTSTLDEVESRLLWTYDANKNTCSGDSGGPSFMRIGNQEVVVGVTSFGDKLCEHGGANGRVDAYAAFLDKWVADNDPAPSDHCGADGTCATGCASPDPDCSTNPGATCAADGMCVTSCSTPDPDCPHTGGTLGSSCSKDSDCTVGVCSEDAQICVAECGGGSSCPASYSCVPSGSHDVCMPESRDIMNMDVAGGCAVGGGGSGSGSGAGLLALLLLATLARRRRVR